MPDSDQPNGDRSEHDELAWMLRRARRGWKHSQFSEDTREFIISREDILRAWDAVRRMDWQHIDASQEKAEAMRHAASHALYVLVQAMRNREIDHL